MPFPVRWRGLKRLPCSRDRNVRPSVSYSGSVATVYAQNLAGTCSSTTLPPPSTGTRHESKSAKMTRFPLQNLFIESGVYRDLIDALWTVENVIVESRFRWKRIDREWTRVWCCMVIHRSKRSFFWSTRNEIYLSMWVKVNRRVCLFDRIYSRISEWCIFREERTRSSIWWDCSFEFGHLINGRLKFQSRQINGRYVGLVFRKPFTILFVRMNSREDGPCETHVIVRIVHVDQHVFFHKIGWRRDVRRTNQRSIFSDVDSEA